MNKLRRRTLDIYFIFGYQQQGKQPPSEPMILKYFKTYYFATYGSTNACSILVAKYPDPLLLA
jgi:hypothetical protein